MKVFKGFTAKIFMDNLEVGNCTNVTFQTTQNIEAYYGIEDTFPTWINEGTREISGTLTRPWVNIYYLSLLLGGMISVLPGKFAFTLALRSSTDDDAPLLYLYNCRFNKGHIDIPASGFLEESYDFISGNAIAQSGPPPGPVENNDWSYLVYRDTYYTAINSFGEITFGGEFNAGGVDGTDVVAVITACVDALPDGGTIAVKSGLYILARTIAINSLNIKIVGEGMNTIFQLDDDANCDMFSINNSKFTTLQYFQIDGNATHNITGRGIYVVTIGYSDPDPTNSLAYIFVHDCPSHGVELAGDIRSCSLFEVYSYYNRGNGFRIAGGDHRIVNCVAGQNRDEGFFLRSDELWSGAFHCNNCKAFGNGVFYGAVEAHANGWYLDNVKRCIFSNCSAHENGANGIVIAGGANGGEHNISGFNALDNHFCHGQVSTDPRYVGTYPNYTEGDGLQIKDAQKNYFTNFTAIGQLVGIHFKNGTYTKENVIIGDAWDASVANIQDDTPVSNDNFIFTGYQGMKNGKIIYSIPWGTGLGFNVGYGNPNNTAAFQITQFDGTLLVSGDTLNKLLNLVNSTGINLYSDNYVTKKIALEGNTGNIISVGYGDFGSLKIVNTEVISSSRQLTGIVSVTENLIPTTTATYDLGSPSNKWNNLYVVNLSLTGNIITTGYGDFGSLKILGTEIVSATRQATFTQVSIGPDVVIGSSKDANFHSLQIGSTEVISATRTASVTQLSIGSDIVIGTGKDFNANSLAINSTTVINNSRKLGNIASVMQTLLPDATTTYDLGSGTYKWNNLFLSGYGDVGSLKISGTEIVSSTRAATFIQLTVAGTVCIGTSNDANFNSLAIGGSTIVNSSRQLGNISSVIQSLTPTTTATYDLGTPTFKWNNLYVVNLSLSGNVITTGYGDFGSLKIGGTEVISATRQATFTQISLGTTVCIGSGNDANFTSLLIGSATVINSSRVLANVTADAGIITSGTFGLARIPRLDLTKIPLGTSGWFLKGQGVSDSVYAALVAGDIPSLDATKITSGTFDEARIPHTWTSAGNFGSLQIGGTEIVSATRQATFTQLTVAGTICIGTANDANFRSLMIGGTTVIGNTRILANVTADVGIITSGRFSLDREPLGTSGWFLKGQGASNSVYAALTLTDIPTMDLAHIPRLDMTKIPLGTSGYFIKGQGASDSTYALLAAADIPSLDAAKIGSGSFGIARGGTGLTTIAAGGILYASALDTLTRIAPTAANQVLRSTAANALQIASLTSTDIPSLPASIITSGTFDEARIPHTWTNGANLLLLQINSGIYGINSTGSGTFAELKIGATTIIGTALDMNINSVLINSTTVINSSKDTSFNSLGINLTTVITSARRLQNLIDIIQPTSAPAGPSTGSSYYDAPNHRLYIYDGAAWKYTLVNT